MRRLGNVLTITVAVVSGLLILLGQLTPLFADLAPLMLQTVTITIAVAVFIGVLNLIFVHLGRIARLRRGWPNSLFLVMSALAVIGLTYAERAGVVEMSPPLTDILLETVQFSVESSLAGLLVFALVYGAVRMMQKRVTWTGILFIAAMVLALVAQAGVFGAQTVAGVLDVPVSAGARGILLGIALATIVTGVRVLIGQDRSYRE